MNFVWVKFEAEECWHPGALNAILRRSNDFRDGCSGSLLGSVTHAPATIWMRVDASAIV
jgi:hypothetical protein